ncbi:MAG: ABC transporter ATP-binding protein [Bacteroidetes bacterium]|nr:ABC transporter ATP-binding protein [Bacteroidota bacterium]
MIAVEHLGKFFGEIKAVDDISFDVQEHETLVLLGTSGCGKTTTLKMLNRLIEPTKGVISINGKNILEQKPQELRRGIGYVLQNTGLFPHYTIAENMSVVPQLLQWDSRRIEKRVEELIDKLHLSTAQLKAYPNELSGGQQQRVGLARALMADPPILLMDEPFGALDTITRSKIQAEFRELDELKRKTIVMVTHDVQEAFELGDRICLMDKGKIVQIGTPSELLYKPVNNFVQDFLKDQRLQLEFRSVKIKDLWNWLPLSESAKGHLLSVDSNIWSGLQKLDTNRSENLHFTHQHETRTAGFEQLMSAFHQYQSSRAHE